MIMRNMTHSPREFVLRSYDLKGSVSGRQELDSYHYDSNDVIKGTLKDLDFILLERTLHIKEEFK